MNLQESINFVEAKGSELEKARLNQILYHHQPPPDVTGRFLIQQNEDGGFPYQMEQGKLSTINDTTVALWWMEELDLLSFPPAKRAFSYLLNAQQSDGSWDEDPRLADYDLPPWIQLGDLKTRLYLSAYAAYWLAVGGYTSLPAFRKALHFLLRHQDDSGKFLGYLHTNWIAISVFLLAGARYAKISSLGIRTLTEKSLSEWDDSQIAWASDCLSRGGLVREHPLIQDCLNELARRQKADGSWASEDGEAFAVNATIQSLKVLKRFGLLPGVLEG